MKRTHLIVAIAAATAAHLAAAQNTCTIDGQQYQTAEPCPAPGTVGEELARRKLKKRAALDKAADCAARFKGYPPVNTVPWDGSLYAVKAHIRERLRDPDSFQAIRWTRLVKGCGTYTIGVRYRARDGFGGYTIEDAVATIHADGRVISLTPTR